ncbi:MAG: HYR domain-containing protein [Planctomycetes bacterium]|nr:HYR domain-containing protein [Planctomycetota bacterium]
MNGSVYSLTVYDDGSGPALHAGGNFSSAGGGAASGVAKWDGSSWAALRSGMSNPVQALTVYDDGSGPALYAGGDFLSAPDSGDSYLAKWMGCPPAPTLSCPQSVFALDRRGSPPGEVVTFSVTATDYDDPTPVVVCVPPSGSFFPRGTTLVNCTATDASGNQSTCGFPVTVQVEVKRRQR